MENNTWADFLEVCQWVLEALEKKRTSLSFLVNIKTHGVKTNMVHKLLSNDYLKDL